MTLNRRELEKIANALRAAINKGQAALDLVERELVPVEVPAAVAKEVQRKLAARICLAWDHKIPDGDRVVRGQCETDYATTRSRIRRGEVTEQELIMRGEMTAEAKKGGRKAARDIAADKALQITHEELQQVAEDIEQFEKPKDKGKADGGA